MIDAVKRYVEIWDAIGRETATRAQVLAQLALEIRREAMQECAEICDEYISAIGVQKAIRALKVAP